MEAKNAGIDEKLFEELLEVNRNTNFHQLIGVHVVELGQGYAVTEIEIEEKHLNPLNIAHGGVLFSVMDITMGMAARTVGKQVITIEMNINYLSPIRVGEKVKAKGKIVHAGSKTTVAVCEAYAEDGRLLAVARETFFNM
ncbi:PaaI family thioesterase [Caldanaerobacter subterraneus]|uniref:Acyl-CoA thioesterase n=1 Tax=Caldanaerobacter subterraneus TaxID=911092 RepID=A0A4R2JTB4_9THEO|nr:PaaI family thioesterase [Caldanaerobacter subterraneus]TCO63601.1 acyl-CoA thioesterase [Caldanaerobacter subterraneus]